MKCLASPGQILCVTFRPFAAKSSSTMTGTCRSVNSCRLILDCHFHGVTVTYTFPLASPFLRQVWSPSSPHQSLLSS